MGLFSGLGDISMPSGQRALGGGFAVTLGADAPFSSKDQLKVPISAT